MKGRFTVRAAVVLGAIAASASVAADVKTIEVEVGVRTIEEAQQIVRDGLKNEPGTQWRVLVKAGRHELKRPLTLTAEDSGRPGAPVVWTGEKGASVISGGREIAGWKDVGDGVWEAPAPRNPSGGVLWFEQLWADGRRAVRSRFPDEGFLVPLPCVQTVTTNAGGKVWCTERTSFTNGIVAALGKLPKGELDFGHLFAIQTWGATRRIIRGFDPETLTVETQGSHVLGFYRTWSGKTGPGQIWFENVRCGFDRPGEWFYDRLGGKILYRPLPGEDPRKMKFIAPAGKMSEIVRVRGAHDIEFRGIAFAHSDTSSNERVVRGPTQVYQDQSASRENGSLELMDAKRLVFDGCTFAHTGNHAMRWRDGCVSNRIVNCRFDDLGAGGIWMGASKGWLAEGEKPMSRRPIFTYHPKSTAFNRIENCLFTRGGRVNPEGSAVVLSHCSDSTVKNCRIDDFYYTGISAGWTWGCYTGSVSQRNEISFNRVTNIGQEVMADLGGIYTLAASFGTCISNNVVAHISAYHYGGCGIYPDQSSEGIVFENNLVYDTGDGCFSQHFGQNCLIRNNIFAMPRSAARCTVAPGRLQRDGFPTSLNAERNIIVSRGVPLAGRPGTGKRGAAPWIKGEWKNNLWWDYSGKPVFNDRDWKYWTESGNETGGVLADPKFADPDKRDFTLAKDSPAFKIGFKPFDPSRAGLRNESLLPPAPGW